MPIFGEEFDPSAWDRLKMRLRRMSEGITPKMKQVMEDEAKFMLEEVQKNIHEVHLIRTGEYLGSWQYTSSRSGFDVWSDHPAAHRLEYGFVGTDALGRSYHDSPRPHLRPAVQATVNKFGKDMANGVQELWLQE